MSTPIENQLTPEGGWQSPGRVRLSPMTLDELSADQKEMADRALSGGDVNAPNLFLTLLRNLRLFKSWLGFASRMMPFGRLDRRDAELAILRVGWNCRARYEWGQHVDIGLRAGLTEDEIKRVADGPVAAGWSDKQRAILQACDEIHQDKMISEKTWQYLESSFERDLLLELVLLINHYEMLAGVLLSTGIELDAPLEEILANANVHEIAI